MSIRQRAYSKVPNTGTKIFLLHGEVTPFPTATLYAETHTTPLKTSNSPQWAGAPRMKALCGNSELEKRIRQIVLRFD